MIRTTSCGPNLRRARDSGLIDDARWGEKGWPADRIAREAPTAREAAMSGTVEDRATES
jgi:hypothetical protein